MALNFPDTPSVGQLFPSPMTAGVPQWRWDGAEWVPNAIGALALTGSKTRGFTSSQTYTPTPGMMFAIVECQGAGGGGGGCAGAAAVGAINGGGGGGAGTWARSVLSAAQIGVSQAITIGAAGSGGAVGANNGIAGGQTSFGALVTAPGGNGGSGVNGMGSYGAGGVASAVGTADATIQGGAGGQSIYVTSLSAGVIVVSTNKGGDSVWGRGGITLLPVATGTSNGANGIGFGSGGAGAIFQNVAANAAGGAGGGGLCVVTEFGNFGAVAPAGSVIRGEIHGLTLSTAGSSTTFSIAAGIATDSTFADTMSLASAYTKTTAAWAAGSGNGALDTGAIANSTWYHVYLIENSATGVDDVLISQSATAPTMPSGYSLFRRIGSMKTNASAQWIKFLQVGDYFYLDSAVLDISAQAITTATSPAMATLPSVPLGISTRPIVNWQATNPGGGTGRLRVYSPLISDGGNSAANISVGDSLAGPTSTNIYGEISSHYTNTSQQLRVSTPDTSGTAYNATTLGWIDRRGRDA